MSAAFGIVGASSTLRSFARHLYFTHLVRSRRGAAKPINCALTGRFIVFPLVPICKRACMGINEKTIATFVTTVYRLGGEDKIRTCGRVTPTAV